MKEGYKLTMTYVVLFFFNPLADNSARMCGIS